MTSPRAPCSRLYRPLLTDCAGATLVEFAILMPAMLILIFGTLEFGLNVYMRAVLEGAMQQAGRNSGLQSSATDQAAIDQAVTDRVRAILPNASVAFSRRNYETFGSVGRPEDFDDTNGNGTYDAPECFRDANSNGRWDADNGRTGLGGANDVVRYTATVTYASWIPAAGALGISPTTSIQANTVLRNQPYATQRGRNPTQICA